VGAPWNTSWPIDCWFQPIRPKDTPGWWLSHLPIWKKNDESSVGVMKFPFLFMERKINFHGSKPPSRSIFPSYYDSHCDSHIYKPSINHL
jgi:hypothetical protein